LIKCYTDYLLITLTLLIMVLGQVFFKIGSSDNFFINIFIGMGYVLLIIRGLLWIVVLRKFPLSFAYPFLSMSFVLLLMISSWFFGEAITLYKIIGSLFIVAGVFFTSIGELTRESK